MFSTLSRFFSWCIKQQVLDGLNPCAGLDRPTVAPSRERALDDAEIKAFWTATARLGAPYGPALRLLLLTGQRLHEISDMRLDEISRDGLTLSLAPARTKNKRAHFVPLAQMARAEISSVPRIAGCSYIFSTTGRGPINGWNKAKRRLDIFMEEELGRVLKPWRIHDLRRTCATTLAKIGIDLVVTEKLLNHSGASGGLVGIYQRYNYKDERRAALEAYERFLMRVLDETEAANNVVELRG